MEIEVVSPIEVEAEVQRYMLVSDDIYMRRYDNNNIPQWYKDMINTILTTAPTMTDLQSMIAYLNSLQPGYNFAIASLQDGAVITNSTVESLVSKDAEKTAAIATLNLTKITATDATAISDSTVAAYFNNGSAGAWFSSNITAYASAIEANATNYSTLAATLGGITASVSSIDSALVTTTGWAASSSKFITAPNGAITGWSISDGGTLPSEFVVTADNFKVHNGTTGVTPFSISGSDISFNGVVNFSNVTNTPVINKTFEQISAPTTGMIIGDTWIDTDDGYKAYTYTTTGWVAPASGGAKVFAQTTAPTVGMVLNDIWYDTDAGNAPYRYDGIASWVLIRDSAITTAQQTADSKILPSQVNANVTSINGGVITTGTVYADAIVTGSLTVTNDAFPLNNASLFFYQLGANFTFAADDTLYTVIDKTFTMPSTSTELWALSTCVSQISCNILNFSTGSNYGPVLTPTVYINGVADQCVTQVPFIKLPPSLNTTTNIAGTTVFFQGIGKVSAGSTVRIVLQALVPVGSSQVQIQDIEVTATIYNKVVY